MNDFCLAPWTHTYISPQGERRLCCASREPAQNFKQYIDTDGGNGQFSPLTLEEWWNSEHLKNIRKTWLSGQVPSSCEVCDKKLLNTSVYKDYFGHLFGHLRDQVIETTDSTGATTMRPISWDYRYSNVCNFKCRMCGDMLSSAWEVEVQKNQMVDLTNPKNFWMQPENRHAIRTFVKETVVPEFRSAVENKTIKEVYWVGGEPLLYDEHWEFMNRIVELGYSNQVRARYNTNLSVITHKKGNLYDILRHFNYWEICASIDGTGSVGQYIRSGLNYDTWLENFKEGCQQQVRHGQMRLDFTLTLPGMVEVANIVRLASELNVPLLSKIIFSFSPDILLSPLSLPREILIPWINNIQYEIKPYITHLNKSMWDLLEQVKTRNTFEEEYGNAETIQGLIKGKRHLLKLESIRKDCIITLEDILREHEPALSWYKGIPAT